MFDIHKSTCFENGNNLSPSIDAFKKKSITKYNAQWYMYAIALQNAKLRVLIMFLSSFAHILYIYLLY